MLVTVINLSRKKSFRTSKRIVSIVLPQVSKRVNLGYVPRRVVLELVRNLRKSATRFTCVKLFFADSRGYHGMKCLEIGKPAPWLQSFVYCESSLDSELKMEGWLPAIPLSDIDLKIVNKIKHRRTT